MPTDDTELFQHYSVLRRDDGSLWKLGAGAMGVTYKAIDTNLDVPVALKVINALYTGSDSARERFTREARTAPTWSRAIWSRRRITPQRWMNTTGRAGPWGMVTGYLVT